MPRLRQRTQEKIATKYVSTASRDRSFGHGNAPQPEVGGPAEGLLFQPTVGGKHLWAWMPLGCGRLSRYLALSSLTDFVDGGISDVVVKVGYVGVQIEVDIALVHITDVIDSIISVTGLSDHIGPDP